MICKYMSLHLRLMHSCAVLYECVKVTIDRIVVPSTLRISILVHSRECIDAICDPIKIHVHVT